VQSRPRWAKMKAFRLAALAKALQTENDTQKIDQPPPQNPTTGQQ
jgi:hypothetical protein